MNKNIFDLKVIKHFLSINADGGARQFFRNIPQHAGQTALLAAALIWIFAALAGFYTSVKTQHMIDLRQQLEEVDALIPLVPSIKKAPVASVDLKNFIRRAKKSYQNINFRMDNATIIIAANSTRHFSEFREAIGYIQNGMRQNNGNAWHVSVDKLCVGRECDEDHKLMAALKVSNILLEKPI
jgi:hypothetical protein